MNIKGGRVSITIGGATYTTRAGVSVAGATIERTNETNRDGTGYSTVKGKLATAEISFDRGERSGLVFNDALLLSTFNATIFEEDAGITHLFTKAAFGGTPSLDTESGEISGLKIETDRSNYSFRVE